MIIGPYNVEHLEWGDSGNTYLIVYLLDSPFPLSYFSTQPHWNDLINSGLSIRPLKPGQYYTWDEVNLEWLFDQTKFTPALVADLKAYRDSKIENASPVILTYHEGETDEEELGAVGDNGTLAAIGRKITVAPVIDNPAVTVNYKFKIYTASGAGDYGYRDVDTAFLQALYVALDADNQKNFDAEREVLEQHAALPFTSFEAAHDAFDQALL